MLERLNPEVVIPEMFSSFLITKDDKDKVEALTGRKEKVKYILDNCLWSSTRLHFVEFVEIIREPYPELATLLQLAENRAKYEEEEENETTPIEEESPGAAAPKEDESTTAEAESLIGKTKGAKMPSLFRRFSGFKKKLGGGKWKSESFLCARSSQTWPPSASGDVSAFERGMKYSYNYSNL